MNKKIMNHIQRHIVCVEKWANVAFKFFTVVLSGKRVNLRVKSVKGYTQYNNEEKIRPDEIGE